ncbi:MAG: BPL-N domain-containing protein [Methanobacterium sp.]
MVTLFRGSNKLDTRKKSKNLSLQAINNVSILDEDLEIRVLIYNGEDTLLSSVEGLKNCLKYINNHEYNLKFDYFTSKYIDSSVLSSFDVLIMPGGKSGSIYVKNPKINAKDIKKFLCDGKGYVGICAGSYAASKCVYDKYYGWGISPNIKCKYFSHAGQLPFYITTQGSNILGYSGIQDLYHWNGPAMYKEGSAVTLAEYASKGEYKNYGAIVSDNYGSGKVLLSGPHPELSPSKPQMIAFMIKWASNKK